MRIRRSSHDVESGLSVEVTVCENRALERSEEGKTEKERRARKYSPVKNKK